MAPWPPFTNADISIHVLRAEDDINARPYGLGFKISIHVLRAEDDLSVQIPLVMEVDFNPRPPCGGRLANDNGHTMTITISIHVLRAEDDVPGR